MKPLSDLTILLIFLFFTSCKNSIQPESSVNLTILNQQGQNLLASPAVYTKENIDIFYVVNGIAQPYKANSSKGFFLSTQYDSQDEPWMRVDLNSDRKEKYPLTLIKFGSEKTDTIKAKFKYVRQSTPIIQKVWLNGVEKDTKGFVIIK